MAPPTESFPAAQLASRVQITALNRRRKDVVDLSSCKLFEMASYDCAVLGDDRGDRGAPVVCRAVERLFRRCKDRNGEFTVETTAWEGSEAARKS